MLQPRPGAAAPASIRRGDRGLLVFKSLGDDGKYHVIERSLSFPVLSSDDLRRFIKRRGAVGEIALDEELRQWVRAALGTERQ